MVIRHDPKALPPEMAVEEYRAILDLLGWGSRTVAEILGINEQTPRRWANGQPPHMPANVARWLRSLRDQLEPYAAEPDFRERRRRLVRAALKAHPRPEGWTETSPPPRRRYD